MPVFAFMGLMQPGLQGLMTQHVSPMEQGRLQGANQSTGGHRVDRRADHLPPELRLRAAATWPSLPGLPILIAAVLLGVSLALAWRFRPRRPRRARVARVGMSEARGSTPVQSALNPMTLTFVLAVVLLNTLSLGIVSPVLPILVKQLANGNTVRGRRSRSACSPPPGRPCSSFFAPVLGVLSDRFGRRPVVLLAMLQLSVDYVVMALAPTLAWLFVGRLFSGMAAAGRAAMFAYAADVADREERARYFGLLAAVGAVGTMLGPGVGGMLGQISPRAPFWVAGRGRRR